MTTIRIHVAGSLAWQPLLAKTHAAGACASSSPAFFCGEIASPTLASAVASEHRLAGAILLPALAWGVPDERAADLDSAADRVELRVEQIREAFVEIGVGVDLSVDACTRCLENVATMRQTDRRKLERKHAANKSKAKPPKARTLKARKAAAR